MQPFDQLSSVDVDMLLSDIERIVRVESPTSDRSGVNAVLDDIVRQFDGFDCRVSRFDTGNTFGDILKVEVGDTAAKPGILVLSHVDTVHPLGTIDKLLTYRREGDKAYGPGIYDMKACFMVAIAALKRRMEGSAGTLPVTILFTPDEEVGSPVSRSAIEEEAKKNRYVLVTEPARPNGEIVTARKGVARFTIAAEGVPAHAGTAHQKGSNAIRAMAALVTEIEGFTNYERGITTSVGLINGGTGVNVIPQHCTIEVDLRVPDMAAGEEMVARFHALKTSQPNVELRIEGGMNRPPFARDARVDALFDKASAVASRIGFKLETTPQTGGGSDGNFTAALGIPTIDGLGVIGNGAHTLGEHILVSSIAERTCFMQGLLETLD